MSNGKALKCSSGGGNQKHYFCKTYESWIVRATKRRDGLWYISCATKLHTNCTGGGNVSDTRVAAPIVERHVRCDPLVKCTALKLLLAQHGTHVSNRSVNRAKRRVVIQT